jgi:predicted membrane protein
METNRRFTVDKRAFLGLILTVVGFVLLADNLGWIDYEWRRVIISWPMLLIAGGLLNLLNKGNKGFGIVLMAVGTFFIIPRIPNISVSDDYHKLFWAIILVILGLVFIFRSKKDHHCCNNTEKYSSDVIDEINVFGGSEKKLTTNSFRGGKITSVFGGSNYDLLDCKLASGKNVLDMVNVFGGSKILVPSDWKIHVEVVSIFGGFADKRRNVNTTDSNFDSCELHITGVAIFGGGEIKSI